MIPRYFDLKTVVFRGSEKKSIKQPDKLAEKLQFLILKFERDIWVNNILWLQTVGSRRNKVVGTFFKAS